MRIGPAEGAHLTLKPECYQYPELVDVDSDDWFDANWLVVGGTVRTADARTWTFRESGPFGRSSDDDAYFEPCIIELHATAAGDEREDLIDVPPVGAAGLELAAGHHVPDPPCDLTRAPLTVLEFRG